MKNFTLFLVALTLLSGAEAYSIQPKSSIASKQLTQFKKSVGATFAAAAIAANVFNPVADAAVFEPTNFGSSNIIAEKEIRQGVYKEYEIDVTPQNYESAESTFKSAKETKSKKGKYTALLAVLVVGSFVIPMAQYFWYVRDDDSSDKFFAQKVPDPEPEPKKKKGWFN
mmetsp:Transcript_137/g.211  ORF Transcript_137/g.211 Transcript_137/m.211 type:complete len:169 (+) Transcript_137:133-639(+)|eukprot:CAMPEP_0176481082 /NCGR_PEP_ID=MMETSP0200_2-20121128/2625_1 /TAXON_ID=947934 /ORGANISM="Chaetoceros sp., Strain GSL56" /LENGTH=168 /DNA_ID=CAMNT_0017877253 /DNA_START=119 /DNA_END=625 /DNA_ORIENTATION=+